MRKESGGRRWLAGVLTVLMLMSSVNAAAYAAPADTADTSAVVEQPLQTAAMPEATPEATAAVLCLQSLGSKRTALPRGAAMHHDVVDFSHKIS